MKSILIAASLVGACAAGTAFAASSSSVSSDGSVTTSTGSDGRSCEVVHKAADERPGGPLTSTVTAGAGSVSGSTTGGSGVHVEAGNGKTSASAGPGGQTVTTDSNGHCIVTIFDKDKR